MNGWKHRQKGYGSIYRGSRYQKGTGFFGSLIRRVITPFAKYLGEQGLKTTMAIGRDLVENPNAPIKEIAKKRLMEAADRGIDDGAKRLKKFVQTGEGLKRNKKTSTYQKPKNISHHKKSKKVVANKRHRNSTKFKSIL